MTLRVRRVAATAVLAILACLAAAPGIAAAAQVGGWSHPRPGKGVIDMVIRTCGSSYGWERVAADNGLSAPFIVYEERSYKITCYSKTNPPTAKPPAVTKPSARGGWTMPLIGARCVSGWGAPRAGHSHHGIDLVSSSRAVVAAALGKVIFEGYETGGAGNYIKIRHGTGPGARIGVYMHLAGPSPLSVGDSVVKGQYVGKSGDTGDPKPGAIHLHFELRTREYEHWVDPTPYLEAHGVNVPGC